MFYMYVMCFSFFIIGTADNRQAETAEDRKADATDSSSVNPTLEQYIAEARKKAEELKEKSEYSNNSFAVIKTTKFYEHTVKPLYGGHCHLIITATYSSHL